MKLKTTNPTKKKQKNAIFLFHNGLFLDQKIDEKRTMLPKFFHHFFFDK
jgi:hypothetical protein